MTIAQVLFVVALVSVLLLVVGFSVVVAVDASRSGARALLTPDLLRRMRRSPSARAELDRWAFYAHRVSGFAIFAFLGLHIVDVSLYGFSPQLYDQVHELYGTPPLRVFECGLLVAILFHTFNGLRVLAIDLFDLDVEVSRHLLTAAFGLTVILGLLGSAVILKPVIV